MATVTVFTADRTAEIEATSIVSGEVNDDGHLILMRHDGTPLDMGAVSGMQLDGGSTYSKVDAFTYVGDTDPGAVPNGSVWLDTTDVAGPFASDEQKGLVQLATSAETITGTNSTKAITPAGFAAGFASAYEAVPGDKVVGIETNSITENALPSAYPVGISTLYLTTDSGWTLANGYGTVVTVNLDEDRCHQTFHGRTGGASGYPGTWTRTHHSTDGGGGWTAWQQILIMNNLPTSGITQSLAYTAFPPGLTRLYFTTASSTGWEFAGKAGELVIYRDGDFGKQVFTEHVGGSSNRPAQWFRTANTSSGWSAWQKPASSQKLPVAMLAGRTSVTPAEADVPEKVSVTFPAGWFTSTPNVVVGQDTTVPGTSVAGVSVSSVTASGFDIYLTRSNTILTWVQWTAIQM